MQSNQNTKTEHTESSAKVVEKSDNLDNSIEQLSKILIELRKNRIKISII